MSDLKYAFWPGCVARGAAPELYTSTLAVAKHLGMELVELEAAACTGAGIISDSDPYLAGHAQRAHLRAG